MLNSADQTLYETQNKKTNEPMSLNTPQRRPHCLEISQLTFLTPLKHFSAPDKEKMLINLNFYTSTFPLSEKWKWPIMFLKIRSRAVYQLFVCLFVVFFLCLVYIAYL